MKNKQTQHNSSNNHHSSIEFELRELIKKNGYVTIDEFMNIASIAKSNSYYRNLDNIGENGDFITAPEISQLFPEMIALWLINIWESLDRPNSYNIYELGPGTGNLISLALKVMNKIMPESVLSINSINLLEINPYFIAKQKENLSFLNNTSIKINWSKSLILHEKNIKQSNIPNIILANEFFDALPIKQYFLSKDVWYEKIITTNYITAELEFSKKNISSYLSDHFTNYHPRAIDGAYIEESPEIIKIFSKIADLLSCQKAAALIIDYGYFIEPNQRKATQYNSTLQAMINHQYVNCLSNIGFADITSHVDFYKLYETSIAHNINTENIYFQNQADFLKNYGILKRAEMLKKSNPSFADLIDKQLDRLINEKQMGNLFKVMEIRALI